VILVEALDWPSTFAVYAGVGILGLLFALAVDEAE
jgi:hypothetical protein